MYSLPSRSQRRHPFAFFIAIGYGSKYFTPAVTPPGRERRARSAYARDAFVLAAESVSTSDLFISGSHLASGRYTLRGPLALPEISTSSAEPTPAPAQRQPTPRPRRLGGTCDVAVVLPLAQLEVFPPRAMGLLVRRLRDNARGASR